MPIDDKMDDQYVAELLTREARESSQRYQTTGSYMARRPAGNAPKPNTKFLRHLIKETDNHNTALKRKEEREARDRLRHLRARPKDDSVTEHPRFTRGADRSSSPGLARSRREEHHDRQQRDERRSPRSQRKRLTRDSSTERDQSRSHSYRESSRDRSSRHHRHREHRDRDQRDHEDKSSYSDRRESTRKRRSHRETSPSRSRSRSPRRARSSGRHRSRMHRRSESPSDKRSSHSRRTGTEHRSRNSTSENSHHPRESHSVSTRSAATPRERRLGSPSSRTAAQNTPRHHDSDYSSDVLEDLVGPLPPQSHDEGAGLVRSRGRGAYKSRASNIDAHFAPDYDPTADPLSDDDQMLSQNKPSRRPVAGLMTADDDWDMALEAMRDRQRWKAKGEERLRAAGMSEEIIDRWKKNAAVTGADTTERDPESVRWAKKGEGREWDRGKVIDEDGHVDVRAAW
ncbi:hypothetical protein F1880_009152 [Penicillium rolfsii]|nr:hypothetical protein F1880_009152 [Penicillium rolfsii]